MHADALAATSYMILVQHRFIDDIGTDLVNSWYVSVSQPDIQFFVLTEFVGSAG